MAEEERREGALEASAAMQPDFKSESITQNQLDKFKELHRRRLQIKAKSKIHKNSKGNVSGAGKRNKKDFKYEYPINGELEPTEQSTTVKDSTCLSSLPSITSETCTEAKKKPKLHWGLEIKERWERKSNM
ncbi:hypothetical protein ACHQM5_009451 [Ranunculus cassubicifolius]